MSAKTKQFWIDNHERLVEPVAAGGSAAEIGRALGVSKNAVIGRVQRAGLSLAGACGPRPAPRITYEFLGAGRCVWPHGHPGEPDFRFCGEKTIPGRPYCAKHFAVAYVLPKHREEEAA